VDEPSKDPKIVLEKFCDSLKNYKTKKPLEDLALEGMIVEEFWQHGDKDYRKFEYGNPLVPKYVHLKLPWIMHKDCLVHVSVINIFSFQVFQTV
jgi:hypothetical protein